MSNDTPTPEAPAPVARSRGLLSGDKLRLGVALTAVVLLGGGMAFWLTRPVTMPPAERVAQGLKLLDQKKFGPAKDIARSLKDQNYRHPGFAGVLEFMHGMAVFGLLESSADLSDRNPYRTVVTELREAERLALGKDRRAEWSYALGKSLYLLHESAAARPLLEEALDQCPPARVDTAEMLIDLYLDPGIRSNDLLRKAVKLNDEVLSAEGLDPKRHDVACLQRSEIFLAMGRYDDAERAIERLSAEKAKSEIGQILQARILIAQHRHVAAFGVLKPIAENNRLGTDHAPEACYLMGVAAEALWDRERAAGSSADSLTDNYGSEALFYYKRTTKRYDQSPEATAANLRLGRMCRLAGRDEESLQYYGAALKSTRAVRTVENFRNRWLSLSEFRQAIVEGWNGWLVDEHFAAAISLAEMMTPLFPVEEASEYTARVHQRWAESLTEDLHEAAYTVRQARMEEMRQRWRLSGQAYERLARERVSSAKYPEALWNAADHYYRGHDFAKALELVNQFLATEPDRLMAAALVQRGRIALDLDHLKEAQTDLEHVVSTYPTDPATFTAQYLIGVCHFEQDRLDEAERSWRGLLNSDQLSPSAVEWRDAQVALGRLSFERGELRRREIVRQPTEPKPADVLNAYEEASKHWQEAALLLSRHLERNPQGPMLEEARYYLGKSLQREAEWLGRQYDSAETDNARTQLQQQHDLVLERALRQFELLRDSLIVKLNNDQADDLQRKLLENGVFEIPHTLYDLRRYDDAIKEYSAAINRYPQDVRTLVAYLQMGQCHRRLNHPAEARNMVQQARLLLSHHQIPETAFLDPATNLTRAEWETWLDRARQIQ